jgi:hypothetical protein
MREQLTKLAQLAMLQTVQEKQCVVAAMSESVILNPKSVLLVVARDDERSR